MSVSARQITLFPAHRFAYIPHTPPLRCLDKLLGGFWALACFGNVMNFVSSSRQAFPDTKKLEKGKIAPLQGELDAKKHMVLAGVGAIGSSAGALEWANNVKKIVIRGAAKTAVSAVCVGATLTTSLFKLAYSPSQILGDENGDKRRYTKIEIGTSSSACFDRNNNHKYAAFLEAVSSVCSVFWAVIGLYSLLSGVTLLPTLADFLLFGDLFFTSAAIYLKPSTPPVPKASIVYG